MDRVNVGIIGTGFIGVAHVEALRRLGYVDVIALADVNDSVAEKKAGMLNIGKSYGDYRKLLSDLHINVVHICTPNNLHYEICKEALEAGKHVVCEKPLAMKSSEAEELSKLAREKNLVNAVHFNIRFYPLIHQIREMVKCGELGRILAINGSYQQDWLLFETDYNWRLQSEFSGESRAVADIGSHWLDLVEYAADIKIKEVCADFSTFYTVRKKPIKLVDTYEQKDSSHNEYINIKINTEDYATVLLRFDNGAHGSITVNQMAAGRKNRIYLEIYGSKKSIEWNSERPNELWIGRRDGNNEILMKDPSLLHQCAKEISSFPGGHNEGFPDTSKQMFTKIYKYITEKNYLTGVIPDFPTFESGYRELIVCEDIVRSSRENRWVKVR